MYLEEPGKVWQLCEDREELESLIQTSLVALIRRTQHHHLQHVTHHDHCHNIVLISGFPLKFFFRKLNVLNTFLQIRFLTDTNKRFQSMSKGNM